MGAEEALNKFFKKQKPRIKPLKTPVFTKKHVMREKMLEKQIIWRLDLAGYVICKSGESSVYNSRFVLAGMSDLQVFVKNKGVMFMEVKTEKGRQRKTQEKFEILCGECNLKYVLVRSVEEALKEVQSYEAS